MKTSRKSGLSYPIFSTPLKKPCSEIHPSPTISTSSSSSSCEITTNKNNTTLTTSTTTYSQKPIASKEECILNNLISKFLQRPCPYSHGSRAQISLPPDSNHVLNGQIGTLVKNRKAAIKGFVHLVLEDGRSVAVRPNQVCLFQEEQEEFECSQGVHPEEEKVSQEIMMQQDQDLFPKFQKRHDSNITKSDTTTSQSSPTSSTSTTTTNLVPNTVNTRTSDGYATLSIENLYDGRDLLSYAARCADYPLLLTYDEVYYQMMESLVHHDRLDTTQPFRIQTFASRVESRIFKTTMEDSCGYGHAASPTSFRGGKLKQRMTSGNHSNPPQKHDITHSSSCSSSSSNRCAGEEYHVSCDVAALTITKTNLEQGQYYKEKRGKKCKWQRFDIEHAPTNVGGFHKCVIDTKQPNSKWELMVRIIDDERYGIVPQWAKLVQQGHRFKSVPEEEEKLHYYQEQDQVPPSPSSSSFPSTSSGTYISNQDECRGLFKKDDIVLGKSGRLQIADLDFYKGYDAFHHYETAPSLTIQGRLDGYFSVNVDRDGSGLVECITIRLI